MQDLLLRCADSLVVAHGPQIVQASVAAVHELSCSELYGVIVPLPGIKPESPALQGKFLTTGLPGKS